MDEGIQRSPDALPSSPGVPNEPGTQPIITDPLKGIKLIKREAPKSTRAKVLKFWRKRFLKEKQKAAVRFSVPKRWSWRNTIVPPEVLEKAIARDGQMKRLKLLAAQPHKLIAARLRKEWIEKRSRTVMARLEKYYEQVKPLARALVDMDKKIQKAKITLEYIRATAQLQLVPTAHEYKRRMLRRVKQIKRSCAMRISAGQRSKLLLKHGVWRFSDPTNKQGMTLDTLKSIVDQEQVNKQATSK